MAGFVCVLGEVRTGLLRHSTSVSIEAARQLVDVAPGLAPICSERPIAYVRSPPVLSGIDCPIAPPGGARVRAIGTVTSLVTLTGGRLLQATSMVTLAPSAADRRLTWSHYTASPGIAELVGKSNAADIVEAFLAPTRASHINLGAISSRLVDQVQRGGNLDGRPSLRAERGGLRWAIVPGATAAALLIGWDQRVLRTVRLSHPDPSPPRLADLFDDIARHDWLLTTALNVVERTRRGAEARDSVDRIRAAVETLLPLWMPAARSEPAVTALWRAFDDRSGLSRQWQVVADQLRDRLLAHALEGASVRLIAPRQASERVLDA